MSSLFDIGKSGLQSYRQSLAVTGQNIANINTDGYKRREAGLEEITASQGGITGIANQSGLGVRIDAIRRSFDSYLIDRNRSATAYYEAENSFLNKLKELEDMMLPTDSNLGIVMGRFFNSLQEVAAAPGDVAPRTVAMEMADLMAGTFRSTAQVVEEVKSGILKQAEIDITSINTLSNELANINKKLLAASGSSNNSLLDNRDMVIDEISKLIEVTTELDTRGTAQVRLGKSQNGPFLVSNTINNLMSVSENLGSLAFSIFSGGKNTPTSQVVNGSLRGLSDSFKMSFTTLNDLDEMAFVFSNTLNAQHKEGLDLKGSKGTDLFISKGFELSQSMANLGTFSAELDILNIQQVVPKNITVRYNGTDERWNAFNEYGENLGSGTNSIQFPGMRINFAGSPRNGDELFILPSAGFAKNLQFSLKSGDQIAAAASNLVFADTKNNSTIELITEKLSPIPTNLNVIGNVLSNSMSSVGASNFIKNGAVAYIPANSPAVEIVSLTQQSQLTYSIPDKELKNASTLQVSVDGGATHIFDISFATNMPGEAGSWQDVKDISKRLNSGTIKNASGQSLQSLGMQSSGGSGNLTISLASGSFNSDQSLQLFSSSIGASRATVKSRSAASDLQIFTKEGRHLAGSPLSTDEIAEFLTIGNGFNKGSTYRADYLNSMDQNGYRGMEINRSSINTNETISVGGNGSTPQIIPATTFLPFSPTNAWALKLNNSKGLNIPAGSSAKYAAELITNNLSQTGITASARARVELWHEGSGGTVKFQLGSKSNDYAEIEAVVSSTNLSALAEKINQYTPKTGVTATASNSKGRLILESDSGEDIKLLNFDFDNKSGKTLSTRLTDRFSKPLSDPVLLGSTNGGTPGVSTFSMSGSFTNNQTALFTLESSTFTYTANGNETAAQARDRLLTNPGSGEFQGSNNETIKLISPGVLQVSDKDGKKLFKIETDGTTTGLKVTESNPDGTFSVTGLGGNIPPNNAVSTTASITGTALDTARYCGELLLSSSTSFTANIAGVATNSTPDNRIGGLVTITPNTTGEKNSLEFHSIDGVDTNSSDPNGLDAVAAAGTFSLSLPTTGTGSTISTTINTKDITVPSPENVAKAVLNSIRNQGAVSSLSGVSAIAGIAGVSTFSMSGAFVNNQTSIFTLEGSTFTYTANGNETAAQARDRLLTNPGSGEFQGSNGEIISIDSSGRMLVSSKTSDPLFTIESDGTTAGLKVTERSPDGAFSVTNLSGNIAPTGLTSVTTSVAMTLPNHGDSVSVTYEDKIYTLTVSYENPETKANPEISVTGGESGRISAYFDKDGRLQVAATGGTISGGQIEISDATKVANNVDAAKRFGLRTNTTFPTRTLVGSSVTLSNTVGDYPKILRSTLNGNAVNISLSFDGTNYSLNSSSGSLSATFSDTGSTTTKVGTNKIILKSTSNTGTLVLPTDTNTESFGFKILDYKLELSGQNLDITSKKDKVIQVSASGNSIAENRVKISNLPNEDLIVLLTGSGSRKLASNYDIAAPNIIPAEEDFTVKIMDDLSTLVEILDTKTGHSIATRILDGSRSADAVGQKLQLTGKASKDDTFYISPNLNSAGDARNLDAILAKQNSDAYSAGSGSFQEIFAQIVSKVGSSVNSANLSKDAADAQRNATAEAEAQFSGVSLDTEAANLIEQQQAYQASARILQTARELFDTLLNSV
ncbi:MAG: flagellar hook-associated protein FlgK [Rhodobacteraceae bacterium]|nr:flagellar hook-associated protein FlgK [Paracoccaceae bacterium]